MFAIKEINCIHLNILSWTEFKFKFDSTRISGLYRLLKVLALLVGHICHSNGFFPLLLPKNWPKIRFSAWKLLQDTASRNWYTNLNAGLFIPQNILHKFGWMYSQEIGIINIRSKLWKELVVYTLRLSKKRSKLWKELVV